MYVVSNIRLYTIIIVACACASSYLFSFIFYFAHETDKLTDTNTDVNTKCISIYLYKYIYEEYMVRAAYICGSDKWHACVQIRLRHMYKKYCVSRRLRHRRWLSRFEYFCLRVVNVRHAFFFFFSICFTFVFNFNDKTELIVYRFVKCSRDQYRL